eukprot:CAMPEP_0117753990 /NCGR_PEP_ID=MMETSP0947-20121206/12567_1 /TAXON_ID=44440 /ORGANISM="Chattonella subsalsa, Strain CCMP2191" /LENGTH=756 /DNA_ID=CAMNT_0005573003 /DNA_START=332 /DNA_END=2602 /DNA_ORIENTATION=-
MGGDGTYEIKSEGAKQILTVNVGESPLIFETGVIGRQAHGSIILKNGETVLYASACADKNPQEIDFSPLRVDYFERFSAAGMTSGAYNKRDGRPSDHEILVSRLIDRPLRPTMAKGYTHETQLLTWVLSYDDVHQQEPLAMTASAAALMLSQVPLNKAVAGVQVGLIDGEFIINPTVQQMETSKLDLLLAGTEDGILMIEGKCDFLTEEQMVEAIDLGQKSIGQICKAIAEWNEVVGKPKQLDTLIKVPEELKKVMEEMFGSEADRILAIQDKIEQAQQESDMHFEVMDKLAYEPDEEPVEGKFNKISVQMALKDLLCNHLRDMVQKTGKRCDGRTTTDVRPISIDVNMLPRTHGSALFTRGETQTIATATLGGSSMSLKSDNIEGGEVKRFYLQYTFPPNCVGEVGRVGGIGRREIGHGNLAERALAPVIPDEEDFPYSIRVESLITESHGSSSMASVCGGCLALMDAGVPITKPIAGVAMGLLLDESGDDEKSVILTDILGIEDALGTMDFKVAGDENGITTFQLDIKCAGLSKNLLTRALNQAKAGRLHILDEMKKACPEPRKELAPSVPKFEILKIDPEKVGKVIGRRGSQIQEIIDTFGLIAVDIDDDGKIFISSTSVESNQKAKAFVEDLVADDNIGGGRKNQESPKEMPVEGTIYRDCLVKGVHNFGVFVEFLPGLEGLVHVSQLDSQRVQSVEAFMKVGDKIDIKYMGLNEKGKYQLSRKEALKELMMIDLLAAEEELEQKVEVEAGQ